MIALLMPVLACGKRGDPRPPLRKTPQPLGSFRVAQRGERLEISGVAPRVSVEGARLATLTLVILRADVDGDFQKVARPRSFKLEAGETFTEPDTLPVPGTVVRIAARTVAAGKPSALTGVVTLPVQTPPTAPSGLEAASGESGVGLKWSGPRPKPLPKPAAPPTTTPPAGSPTTSGTTPLATPPTTLGATKPASASPVAAVPGTGAESHAGFWVYRRAKVGAYDRPLFADPAEARAFVDASAAPGQEWCYVVRAVISSEPVIESTSSNEACLTAADITPPAAPSGLTALARAGALEVRWSPSLEPDLAFYRVYRASVNGAAERLAEVPAGTTVFADQTALAGHAYRYTVTAVDRSGNESAASAPLLGNTP